MAKLRGGHPVLKVMRTTAWVYALLLVVFTSLMIAVHTIPLRAIAPQVERSLTIFERERSYPMLQTPLGSARLDNFTDCYMLNVASCADASRPVTAAMLNCRYRGVDDMAASTRAALQRPLPDGVIDYGKYWHGYQVTLRPLLTVLDYGGLRVLNAVVLLLLLVAAVVLLWRRLGPGVALALVLSLWLMRAAVLPWSLQYSTCHIVMLLSVIVLTARPRLACDTAAAMPLFFAVGAVTVFLDFFTTPVLTLGIPLTVAMLLRRAGGHRVNARLLTALCVAWAAGYGLMWASKWAMAWLLTGHNVLAEVNESMRVHSTGVDGLSRLAMWRLSLSGWLAPVASTFVKAGLLLLFTLAAAIAPAGRHALKRHSWLLAVALLPLLWYAVVTHHSYTHFIITWRMFEVSWFALLCFFLQITDYQNISNYVLRR